MNARGKRSDQCDWLVNLVDMTKPGIYPTPGKVPDFPFFSSSLSADCTSGRSLKGIHWDREGKYT